MAFPGDHWLAGLVHVPEVDEPALASHGNVLAVLPLDLEALEVRVNRTVIEARHVDVLLCRAVPDVDFAHDAARGHQVVRLVAELALHQVLVKVLGTMNLDIAVAGDLPDAGDHVRGAREELVSTGVPVERSHCRLRVLLPRRPYVRDFLRAQLGNDLVSPQVPEVRHEAVACSDEEPALRVELREVDLALAVSVHVRLTQVDAQLPVELQGFNL